MTILLLLMLLGLIPAFIAQSKGRSAFTWWVYGALLFIVALPHALLISPQPPTDYEQKPLRRSCPHCAEDILPAAKTCPFCKLAVAPQQVCDRCKTILSIDYRCCTACGELLRG